MGFSHGPLAPDNEGLSWAAMDTHTQTHLAPVHGQGTGQQMNLPPDLLEQVDTLQRASKAANTRRAYTADWSRWTQWCAARGLPALPAPPEAVAAYLADHAGLLSVSTLRRHLSTVSKAHQVRGLQSPCRSALVADCLAGLRRQHGQPPVAAPPLLADQLRQTVQGLAGPQAAVLRDRALLLVGWCGALRRSELAGLRWGNIQTQPDGLVLTLEHSKTDHAGTGQQVALPYQSTADLCPVRALGDWQTHCERFLGSDAVALDQPVLRQISRQGKVLPAGLSGQAVAAVVTRRCAAVGVSAMQGHSLRVGLIWEASRQGVADSALMQTTRHQGVSMLRRYQREAGLMDRAASRGLL